MIWRGPRMRYRRIRPSWSRLICWGQRAWLGWSQASARRAATCWAGPASDAFEIARLVDLFVAHQVLITGCQGTESGHNRSTRALGWCLTGEGRAQQSRNHLPCGDALPASQFFCGS